MRKTKKKGWVLFNGHLWLNDPELRACSLSARGLWIDLLCWMWQDSNTQIQSDVHGFRRLTGCSSDGEFLRLLDELKINKVATVRKIGDELLILGGKWANQRPTRYINPVVKAAVVAVGRCRYCGATERLTVDHIHPFSLGGTHDPKNLQCLCHSCNAKKKTKSHRAMLRSIKANV